MFASDNGNSRSNAGEGETPTEVFFDNESPRAGMKGGVLDGAFHVPAIARWHNRIQPGQVSDHIWAFWDFMPTVAELVGVEAPKQSDGISLLPTLFGDHKNQKKHELLYWEYHEQPAVRMSNWYGHRNKQGRLSVYDLIANPEQDKDISEQYPEVAKKIDEI